jgi:hypothetical protein
MDAYIGAGHDPNFVGSALKANQLGVKYSDEVHFNAGGGTGVEVLIHPGTSEANKRACRAIAAGIAKVLGIPVRRDHGLSIADDFGFLNQTNMPSAIIEVAFLDNTTDRRAIRRKDALEDVGEAIAEARCAFLGVTNQPPDQRKGGVPIAANKPSASKKSAHRWADSKGCATVFHDIIDAGWINAGDVGIDGAVFVAQSANETGFGRFGGVIDASFHNSGGIKTTAGGTTTIPRRISAFAIGLQERKPTVPIWLYTPG